MVLIQIFGKVPDSGAEKGRKAEEGETDYKAIHKTIDKAINKWSSIQERRRGSKWTVVLRPDNSDHTDATAEGWDEGSIRSGARF